LNVRRHRILTLATLLVAGGCAPSARPRGDAVEVALPPPAKAQTVTSEVLAVSAVRSPSAPIIDGDIGEWTPRSPGAQLAFALTGDRVLIAAHVPEAARTAIWLGIAATPAELPVLGQYFGRMGYVPLECEQRPVVSDDGSGEQGYGWEPNPPETVAACQALLARHAEQTAQHERRFQRWIRIDRDGAQAFDENGQRATIAEARSAWASAKDGTGATVEVSLPLAALPRVAEAPLRSLKLVARAIDAPRPPPLSPAAWTALTLPDPVTFEPGGLLRAHAFARALDVGDMNAVGLTSYRLSRGLSYQPGDGQRIEVVDAPGCDAAVPREERLFVPRAMMAEVQIGWAVAPRGSSCDVENESWLAIAVRGQVVDVVEVPGVPRGIVARGSELHVVSWLDTSWGQHAGTWSVLALSPDGKRREVPVEKVEGTPEPEGPPYWEGTDAFASEALDTFGWRGTRGTRSLEAIWRWDDARKLYAGGQRRIARPPPRKPR
jgi:hypothetical protein